MDATHKVWHCSYRWSGGYGAYEELEVIVVAEIKSKAIGMAVMEHSRTLPKCWSAEEIPLDREGVHWISEASS